MKNKRAWLRIIEAVLAILIIFGAVLYIVSKQTYKPDQSEMIYEKQTQILDMVSKNESLRQMVLDKQTNQIELEISKFVPASWNFSTCISNITLICSPQTPHDRNVYVKEILIASTLQQYSPQKLRFFVWVK